MNKWGIINKYNNEVYDCRAGSDCTRPHVTDFKSITMDEARDAGGLLAKGVLDTYLAAVASRPAGFLRSRALGSTLKCSMMSIF